MSHDPPAAQDAWSAADVDIPFGELVAPHLSTMRSTAASLAEAASVDDVVQEALVRAWLRRSTFRPDRGSARGWLVAITRDQARRHRRRFVIAKAEPLLTQAGPVLGAAADLDLRRAVTALPPRQRQAVIYFYYLDQSLVATAAAMGCSIGTVKSTLADARHSLASTLESEGDRDGQ